MPAIGKKLLGLLGLEKDVSIYLWQDREIRFDLNATQLNPCKGEHVVDIVDNVEDTKGNQGVDGRLVITNLRFVWHAKPWTDNNVSVGLNLVNSIESKKLTSSLKGPTMALNIMTTYNGSRFQFIFSPAAKAAQQLLQTMRNAHASYSSTRLYRDIRLRGAFFKDGSLQLLTKEALIQMVPGVRNLSASHYSGQLWLTNVRVVWTAGSPEHYNISVPLLQLHNCVLKETKVGKGLVLEVHKQSGGYKLGFQMDYVDALADLHEKVTQAWHQLIQAPVFDGYGNAQEETGVAATGNAQQGAGDNSNIIVPETDQEGAAEDEEGGLEGGVRPMSESTMEVQDSREVAEELMQRPALEVLSAYYADACKAFDVAPVFSPVLGLAVEGMKEGVTIEGLWKLV